MKILQNFINPVRAILLIAMILPMFVSGQYYNDVLSYAKNGTPVNGIKIKTNLPFKSSQQMPTIMLEGYNYGYSQPIDIKIVYYIYADKFIHHKAVSTTGYTPDIYLANENGNVVVYLDDRSYFVRFHVRAYAKLYEKPSYFTGWTVADAPKPSGQATGQNVKVPYETDAPVDLLPSGSTEAGVTQIYAPDGGTFVKNGTDVKGAIQIKLPVYYTSTMLKMRVEVFNYVTNKSFTVNIAGYNYAGNFKWHNCSASIITTSLDNEHKVYFGDDGINSIVWIGEPDSKWRYLKVRVSEVQAAHANIAVSKWDSGWSVGLATADFSSKVNRTVTNVLPVASGSSIWQTNNDMVFYPNQSGKVGIGTSSPTAELTVNGHIHAKEVRVYTAAGADFVFDPNYDLKDLEELEKFVTKNQHLPDIPSEKEMIDEGLHLGEMDIKLLQKVEELTLYVIDMNKKMNTLETQNKKLQKEIKSIKK